MFSYVLVVNGESKSNCCKYSSFLVLVSSNQCCQLFAILRGQIVSRVHKHQAKFAFTAVLALKTSPKELASQRSQHMWSFSKRVRLATLDEIWTIWRHKCCARVALTSAVHCSICLCGHLRQVDCHASEPHQDTAWSYLGGLDSSPRVPSARVREVFGADRAPRVPDPQDTESST